jgi:hypothetical protein
MQSISTIFPSQKQPFQLDPTTPPVEAPVENPVKTDKKRLRKEAPDSFSPTFCEPNKKDQPLDRRILTISATYLSEKPKDPAVTIVALTRFSKIPQITKVQTGFPRSQFNPQTAKSPLVTETNTDDKAIAPVIPQEKRE